MPNSKVAILVRTKDRPQLLQRAIASVMDQTFQEWHVVIINDGGDSSPVEAIIKTHGINAKCTIIHHDKPQGMAAATNSGISKSNSTYIALLDDDDTWEPTFLAETIDILEAAGPHSPLQGVATYTNQVFEILQADSIIIKRKERYPLQPHFISFANLLVENQFTNLSFLYRRSALDAIGNYNEQLKLFDDWEFNMRFALQFQIALHPKFLANYHMRLNTSGSNANTLASQSHKELLVAHFRETLLRNDAQQGKFGIGTLMHLSHLNLQVPNRLSILKALRHDLLWLWKKIRQKLIPSN
jgi:glycosyltransferase involved in cell wall biosynthesis